MRNASKFRNLPYLFPVLCIITCSYQALYENLGIIIHNTIRDKNTFFLKFRDTIILKRLYRRYVLVKHLCLRFVYIILIVTTHKVILNILNIAERIISDMKHRFNELLIVMTKEGK